MASAAGILKVIRPHVPLIKFRKGKLQLDETYLAYNKPVNNQQQCQVADTLELRSIKLPKKYLRKSISVAEIEHIMRGGPE